MLPVFQKTIDQITAKLGSAGGAFIAIHDGEVVVKEVFGTADIETGRPITADSIFDIASDTKCMTTAIVAQLVDEGKCNWGDPVRKFYPEFFLCNEAISDMMTLKDLASHRSGICSQNVVRRCAQDYYNTPRKDYIASLKYLTMSKPFRDEMQYQNEYFALLGYIIELIEGKTYEDVVRERIGKRLGIEFGFRGFSLPEGTDIAYPHNSTPTGVERLNHNMFWQNNPCGGARISLNSAEKWLRMWIGKGVLSDGSTFISDEQFRMLTRPVDLWSQPNYDWVEDQCRCYALGLAPSIYRGHKLVYHGGSITGFRSAMGFFPRQNSGYFIMINSTCQPLSVLKILLCDAALGILKDDYSDRAESYLKNYFTKSTLPDKLTPEVALSEEQKAKFFGTYFNGYYGDLKFEDGGENKVKMIYRDIDDPMSFRGVLPTGEYLFQMYWSWLGNFITDVRFTPDGKNGKISFSEYYTPNPFVKRD